MSSLAIFIGFIYLLSPEGCVLSKWSKSFYLSEPMMESSDRVSVYSKPIIPVNRKLIKICSWFMLHYAPRRNILLHLTESQMKCLFSSTKVRHRFHTLESFPSQRLAKWLINPCITQSLFSDPPEHILPSGEDSPMFLPPLSFIPLSHTSFPSSVYSALLQKIFYVLTFWQTGRCYSLCILLKSLDL